MLRNRQERYRKDYNDVVQDVGCGAHLATISRLRTKTSPSFRHPVQSARKKVEEYFAKLMGSLEAATYSRERLRAMGKSISKRPRLVDQDDDDHWRSDLPDKFSGLSEEHFPLFITYDRVRTPTLRRFPVSRRSRSFVQCFRTISRGGTTTMVSLSR